MRMPLAMIMLTAAIAVSGCANKGLKVLQSPANGPDEFAVLPVKPLTAPTDYQFLPAPTPGASNLTDPTPQADAVEALGGRASALASNGIPSSDQALVTASSRYGVPADTRQVLAQEDADFRKRRGRFTQIRLFPVDRYEQVYRKHSIDPYAQAEAFRKRGYPTPSAPPEE
ncbi:DUF3035 domain-containing protein [Ruegeria sp. HKCCD8929]|uniref:DUF3035 domain-containing protein n=1 Tax=Ruegeria sp. HKCCD8929 TaxID=2683006 RepID=UPI0014881051|nr:DUF3035 domain-containing protein [Ruegeria sp. HKCCD8929]